MVLDVKDVRMDGAADDQVIHQRATHIAATKEYTVYKSQLLEAQDEKMLDVTQALKAMKLNTDLTFPKFLS